MFIYLYHAFCLILTVQSNKLIHQYCILFLSMENDDPYISKPIPLIYVTFDYLTEGLSL